MEQKPTCMVGEPPDDDLMLALATLARVQSDGDSALDAACRAQPRASEQLREWVRILRRIGLGGPAEGARTRYQLRDELGRGGMGIVRRAWDGDLDRCVAMKIAKVADGATDVLSADPRLLARFLEEARITARLNHPGVVPVHDIGVDPAGRVFFTMRLVDGCDLRRVFAMVQQRQEGWTLARATDVLSQVAGIMAYAHGKGIIHRDLKPANVMIGRFGDVHVMDWGLARQLDALDCNAPRLSDEASRASSATAGEPLAAHAEPAFADEVLRTLDGDIIGTPVFMSPEQASGHAAAVGLQSDVYAVGAMLYQLLAGRMPYCGPGESTKPDDVLARVRAGDPQPIAELAPDQPRDLIAICARAMARDPGARYPDMSALADDLRDWLEGRVVATYERGALAELRKWARRNKVLALTVVVGLVVLLAGLVAFFTVQSSGRAEVLKLADWKRLGDLQRAAARLWPARPHMIPAMEQWLAGARRLADHLESHRASLARLREQAQRGNDQGSFVFADTTLQWQHDAMAQLVLGLEDFVKATPRGNRLADVQHRVEFARTLEQRTIEAHRQAWAAARDSIADRGQCPLYEGLRLRPQLGLVPLGRDAKSGLWEFAHVQTGAVPERDPDTGNLRIGVETGIVLVLIPGGTCAVGAQNADPNAPGFDRDADADESPVHEVTLAPFFLSKFELTRAQWLRVSDVDPGPVVSTPEDDAKLENEQIAGDLRPIERITWIQAEQLLRQLDLTLPSEAQWEHAARAGTSTPWWTGATTTSLRDAANLSSAGETTDWPRVEGIDDEWHRLAPVGSYLANSFGLHDTIGNVWEWCLDCGSYPIATDAGTGLRVGFASTLRALRGGSCNSLPRRARVSKRDSLFVGNADSDLGVRPARVIEP